MKETAKVRRELTAFHEAGHCVAARVLGMQIEDEGCCILTNDPFLGSTTINLDDLKSRPRDGMVTVIAGPVASVLREADLLKRRGVELSEEILSEVSHSTAEAMVPEVGGPEVDGEISADVDVINNLMAELIGHRCADTSKAVVAQVIALAIVGLDRKFINVRVETDDLAVSDEWYVPLREAVDRAIGVVREHRNMVDALATNLLEVGQMSGPEVIAFLGGVNCPTDNRFKKAA